MKEPAEKQMNEWTVELKERKNKRLIERMQTANELMDQWLKLKKDKRVEEETKERANEGTNKRRNEKDGRMEGRKGTNESANERNMMNDDFFGHCVFL